MFGLCCNIKKLTMAKREQTITFNSVEYSNGNYFEDF